MTFKDGQPIYQQIAERLADEVLSGDPPETRVPGVREYSALLEVNVNTTGARPSTSWRSAALSTHDAAWATMWRTMPPN